MPKLTSTVLKTVNAPGWIWDDDPKVRGFGLRIHSSGTKTFFLSYRINGAERRQSIGRWPTWSLLAAREEAKRLRRLVDQGRDPVMEKRERREAATVDDLLSRYVTDHLPSLAERDHQDHRAMLARIGEHLGRRRHVAEIHHGDILAMHRAITDAGTPVRANRILAVASKLFSLALLPRAGEAKPWRDALMGNPCKGVPRNPETPKERFFSPAELGRISDALNDYGREGRGPGIASAKASADCIRLITLTGCRPSEAMRATWQQFDVEPGFWVKPAASVKQRKTHKLPLSAAALELVERMRKKRKPSATWVFAGQKPGQPLKQLHSIWHQIRVRAELGDDARIYDLRHSFASIGAGGGLSLPLIGRLLGHTQARTTQRYAHLADDPLKEATDKIGAVISGAGKDGAQVVNLKGRAS